MIEFRRMISQSEVNSTYLNLTDEQGRAHGSGFPPHRTKLAIFDGAGRLTNAQKHHDNQIWGSIRNWFQANDIQPGTLVLIKYDPAEMKEGLPTVHLIPQMDSYPIPATVAESIKIAQPSLGSDAIASEIPISFEKQLEDFLASNLHLIETGLKIYKDEDDRVGKQYPTDIGVIDLLCRRANGDYLVIELKRGKVSDIVVGQISRYMGWVKVHIANGAPVSGLILTHDQDEQLKYAVSAHANISLKYFKLKLEFVDERDI